MSNTTSADKLVAAVAKEVKKRNANLSELVVVDLNLNVSKVFSRFFQVPEKVQKKYEDSITSELNKLDKERIFRRYTPLSYQAITLDDALHYKGDEMIRHYSIVSGDKFHPRAIELAIYDALINLNTYAIDPENRSNAVKVWAKSYLRLMSLGDSVPLSVVSHCSLWSTTAKKIFDEEDALERFFLMLFSDNVEFFKEYEETKWFKEAADRDNRVRSMTFYVDPETNHPHVQTLQCFVGILCQVFLLSSDFPSRNSRARVFSISASLTDRYTDITDRLMNEILNHINSLDEISLDVIRDRLRKSSAPNPWWLKMGTLN